MMVCSIQVNRSDAKLSYLSIIFSVSMAWSRTLRARRWKTVRKKVPSTLTHQYGHECHSVSPFQLSCPQPPAASSLRSSGKKLQRTWWWTFHLGSLWTHLQSKTRIKVSHGQDISSASFPTKLINIQPPTVTCLQGLTVWSRRASVLLRWRRSADCGSGWTSSACYTPLDLAWKREGCLKTRVIKSKRKYPAEGH